LKPSHTRILAVLAALLLAPGILPAQDNNPPNPVIETLLSQKGLTIEGTPILAEEIIYETYKQNGFRPIWTRDKLEEMMQLIREAPTHGLDPADYEPDKLFTLFTQLLQNPDDAARARVEILLTESLIRYGAHRRYGKVEARKMDPDINFRRESFGNQSTSQNILDALSSSSLADFIEKAAPTGPYYRHMQDWLARYREIQSQGGYPVVPPGPTLREGDSGPRVQAIRARLTASGDLEAAGDGTRYDSALKDAVIAFQKRHLLDADGIVGTRSIEAMNIPVEKRVDQIRLSLERMRWVTEERASTLVVVNIAQYRTNFFKDGELAWSTRAMVGKNYRKTPVFRGDIAYMEFNPTWTIPPGILRNDTLPAIKKNPNYLAEKNIEVIDNKGRVIDPSTVDWNQYSRSVPYTLRQTPGPHNALGTVKFIFPNKHFVFLHDTPHRELFDRPERAFSSGCIRVEDPLKLAELLLDDPAKYNRSTLQSVIDSRETQRIHLKPKIPVVIVYLTAGLDEDGEIVFMHDVYNRDQRVLDALNGPVHIRLPGDHAAP
jgi:murein L,D-transpeptidase YcbB/YkuD